MHVNIGAIVVIKIKLSATVVIAAFLPLSSIYAVEEIGSVDLCLAKY